MTLIMDGLLLAAACFAGTWCFVLARRVRALRDLDSGIGAAITRMTRTLEDARRALEEAKAADRDRRQELDALVRRAEAASGQLRLLLAATRDLPPEPARAVASLPVTTPPAEPSAAETRASATRAAPPRLPDRPPAAVWPEPDAQDDRIPQPVPRNPGRPARDNNRLAGAAAPVRAAAPARESDILAALAELAGKRRR